MLSQSYPQKEFAKEFAKLSAKGIRKNLHRKDLHRKYTFAKTAATRARRRTLPLVSACLDEGHHDELYDGRHDERHDGDRISYNNTTIKQLNNERIK